MNRWAIACCMVFCTISGSVKSVEAKQIPVPGWHEGSIQQNKVTRYFRYYVPKNLPDRAPVTLLFHGGGQSMRKLFQSNAGGTQAWEPLAEKQKFLLVVPNGINPETGDAKGDKQNWNDCRKPIAGTGTNTTADDVGLTRQLIDWAAKNYQIDNKRVYATGSSNGGLMSYRVAIEMSDRIAAVSAFIANMPADSECKPAARSVPIMITNGTEDPVIPWAGGDMLGGGGEVLSFQETLKYWLRVNRSAPRSVKINQLPDLDRTDGSYITTMFYPATRSGADVLFYSVVGGGHTMPSIEYEVPRFIQRRLLGRQNHDLEGAKAAWDFLSRYQLSR
jgi:polyhydroxybutyrate depolymerase